MESSAEGNVVVSCNFHYRKISILVKLVDFQLLFQAVKKKNRRLQKLYNFRSQHQENNDVCFEIEIN